MPLFDTASETLIRQWDQTLEHRVRITLTLSDHPEDNRFRNISNALAQIISHLVIEPETTATNLPGIMLKENIQYSALPLERELPPFLEALKFSGGPLPELPAMIRKRLDAIRVPVQLKLYIALQCPFCPAMVRTLVPLAVHCPHIRLHIIDGSLFPETAQKDRVLSAPCLILEDDFRWTGTVTAEEITRMIQNRDPSQLSADTLKTILEQGDASWITWQMMEKDQIFDGFIRLLLHPTWSVRLGAMVVVEELAKKAPGLAATLCPILMDLFDGQDTPIQGDMLYALGEAGGLSTKEWITRKLPGLVHQDLLDAASDALETLASKTDFLN